MKLETKYGVLEGTVEEFRELLEGEKDLSYFSGKVEGKCRKEDKSEYYIVNNDSARCYVYPERHIPKGLVLKHKVLKGYSNFYTDTMGTDYMLDDEDLDDYTLPGIEGRFNSFKEDGIILVKHY